MRRAVRTVISIRFCVDRLLRTALGLARGLVHTSAGKGARFFLSILILAVFGSGSLCVHVPRARATCNLPPSCELWYTTDDGESFTLHWKSNNATSAVLTDVRSGEQWNVEQKDLAEGTKDLKPVEGGGYRLTVTGLGEQKKVCQVEIPLPSGSLQATPRAKGFELSWQTRNGTWTLDPRPEKFSSYVTGGGSAYIYPEGDQIYILTVTGKVKKDSRDPKSETIVVPHVSTVVVRPLKCSLEVDQQQVIANQKRPATVRLTWNSEGTKAELQTYVNGKVLKTQKVPPSETQSVDVTATTEFVLTVTDGKNKATCRVCVLNRPSDAKVLPIPPVFQQNWMWCWLTVGQMIFEYYKVPDYNPWKKTNQEPPPDLNRDKKYQWGIVAALHLGCWLHPDLCALKGGSSWENVQRMLRDYPVAAGQQHKQAQGPINSTPWTGCLTADQIKKEIDEGRPILVGISPGSLPPAAKEGIGPVSQHVALIIGYQEINGKLQLIINDPWPYRLRSTDPNPYLKAGGSQNCEANYTIDRDQFCAKLGWQGSFININK